VTTKRVEATSGAEGGATIDWRTDVVGVSASSWRARYHASSTFKQRLQEDLGAEFAGLSLDKAEASDLENLEKGASVHAHGKSAQFARREGDSLSIPVGPAEHMVREFAPLSGRKLDERLYSQSTTASEWFVKGPPGSRVAAAPKGVDLASPFGHFVLTVETEPGGVRVKSTLTITRLRTTASEYAALRAWCEEVDRALSQRLVIALKG
jgi:hypothetical protein